MANTTKIEQIYLSLVQWWRSHIGAIIIVLALIFVSLSLYTTQKMANSLRDKEINDMEVWVHTMEELSRDTAMGSEPITVDMINSGQNIPFVVLDNKMNVIASHLVESEIVNHPDKLRRLVSQFTNMNKPIVFRRMWSDKRYLLFYGKSELLRRLYYVPVTQVLVSILFFLLAYVALRSTKQGEQDRVWVGLAKETAHQLGTPISSLMGWIEHLRDCGTDEDVVEEMSRDLAQLLKVTDRFSKIGSDTALSPASVNEVVASVVQYFRGRLPRGASLSYDGLAMAPAYANINVTLIEWVVENLLKNSLDALAGSGEITVRVIATEQQIFVEVQDSGRGIPKSNWRKIFEPGFTTKTRGWGLGLSLARRVVEDYHGGRIGVIESQAGVGTTMRITLNRVFD